MFSMIGIDIGTTNIEYAFVTSSTNDVNYFIHKNPLTKYGLDVMTRISKANDGLLDEMTSVLRESIRSTLSDYLADNMCSNTQIRIAANVTMIHILMNYDCKNLGSFPFSPVHTEKINTTASSIGICSYDFPVTITPGLSAFVGGDIVSGLSIIPANDNYLLIDLGTNAEMVLIQNQAAYITSAAAGPAFETCSYGHATDAIDGLAHMIKSGIMDETGLLCDQYFETGYNCNNIQFSTRKIRDFQMAKAAIRTGIDLLIQTVLEDSGKQLSDILTPDFRVYIAGNFGTNLNVVNAIYLKLFPQWFLGRCKAMGNTSLKGTITENAEYAVFNYQIKELILANHSDFNSLYIDNMNF